MKPPLVMLVYTHKVMPILSSVLMLVGGKTLYELASLKYCYNADTIKVLPLRLHYSIGKLWHNTDSHGHGHPLI